MIKFHKNHTHILMLVVVMGALGCADEHNTNHTDNIDVASSNDNNASRVEPVKVAVSLEPSLSSTNQAPGLFGGPGPVGALGYPGYYGDIASPFFGGFQGSYLPPFPPFFDAPWLDPYFIDHDHRGDDDDDGRRKHRHRHDDRCGCVSLGLDEDF